MEHSARKLMSQRSAERTSITFSRLNPLLRETNKLVFLIEPACLILFSELAVSI
jgi:hypothetical protein